jgi:hypothetical protein
MSLFYKMKSNNIFDERENATKPRREINFVTVAQKEGPEPITEYFGKNGKEVNASKSAFAKKITTHSGTSQYFIREHGTGTYAGLLVDPFTHTIGNNMDASAQDGSGPTFPLISVSETAFLYYLGFLKTRSQANLNASQKIVRGSM